MQGAARKSVIEIRPAAESDAELVFSFIKELAACEKLSGGVSASVDQIRQSLFGPKPGAEVLLAFVNGEPAGFAVYYFAFSTFASRPVLFLEDIFVRPEFRGRGAGKALFRRLIEIALSENCVHMKWSVLDWNETAIQFYNRIGATPRKEWLEYRLSDSQMAVLTEIEPAEQSPERTDPRTGGKPDDRGAARRRRILNITKGKP